MIEMMHFDQSQKDPLVEPRHFLDVSERGFTLIELLSVIAIIGLLVTITFSLLGGHQERSAVVQVKAELGVLATALEAYKVQYGDYPRTGGTVSAPAVIASEITTNNAQSKLFNALVGKLGPKLDNLEDATGTQILGKRFVETGKFHLETENFPMAAGNDVANSFVDPWGNRYLYFYVDDGSPGIWKIPGYLLYSAGPDELETSPGADGKINYTADANQDNYYANRSGE